MTKKSDKPATILRRAKRVLKERGLNKETFLNEATGSVCLLGAINIAATGKAVSDWYTQEEGIPIFHALEQCTLAATNGEVSYPPSYNDNPKTTEKDIQQLFNCAIKRVEINEYQ